MPMIGIRRGVYDELNMRFRRRLGVSPPELICVKNAESVPLSASILTNAIAPVVKIDCSITVVALPSMLGTIMAGCFLHVQYDLSKILSKNILFAPRSCLCTIVRLFSRRPLLTRGKLGVTRIQASNGI